MLKKIDQDAEDKGLAAGAVTAATGIHLYRSNGLGEGFRGNAFVSAPSNNLVIRKVLGYDGLLPVASRAGQDKSDEFLTSSDNWFRPIQITTGPDGALYLADMYREVIEISWLVPKGIKRKINLENGSQFGRIWRIKPKGKAVKASKMPGHEGIPDLVARLSYPNAWHRQTAARLLVEKEAPASFALLQHVADGSSNAQAKLHALYLLASFGKLDAPVITRALNSIDPLVRVHALRLSEPFLGKPGNASIRKVVRSMVCEQDERVLYQLALTLGLDMGEGWIEPALGILLKEGVHNQTKLALYNTLARDVTGAFRSLQHRESPPAAWVELANGIGLEKGFGKWLSGNLGVQFKRNCLGMTNGEGSNPSLKLAAARLLEGWDKPAAASIYLSFIGGDDKHLQHSAVTYLFDLKDPALSSKLLDNWKKLSAASKDLAVGLLLESGEGTQILLGKLQSGGIGKEDILPKYIGSLKGLGDPGQKKIVDSLFGDESLEDRDAAIKRFTPSLALKGDLKKGKELSELFCIHCHKAGEGGG